MDEIETETKADIDKRAEKLLAEIGIKQPPVNLEAVASFLNVDCGYYNLTDPSFLREIRHKITVGVHNLQTVFDKVDLRGLWLPDRDQVLIDQNLPTARQRWVTAHELSHRLLPTHRPFFFGDTADTLDPEYQMMLESEANYCTQRMLFMGGEFDDDVRSLPHCLESVLALSKRYGNSTASTLRRYVGSSHSQIMAGLISIPQWKHPELSPEQRCRYFLPSRIFRKHLSNVKGAQLVESIDKYAQHRKGGPVGNTALSIYNADGYGLGFKAESFFNTHDILTLMVADM